MTAQLDVKFNTSFYKKTDPSLVKECIEECITELTNEAEKECRAICPVDTGLLRDSHSTSTSGLEGSVHNSTEYWMYVVYGTYKQSPQNYPEEVVNTLNSNDTAGKILKEKLKSKGIE